MNVGFAASADDVLGSVSTLDRTERPLYPCLMRPPQWEYKTVQIDVAGWFLPKVEPDAMDAELNRYGAEGWELVSAFDVNRAQGRTSHVVVLFKRPRG